MFLLTELLEIMSVRTKILLTRLGGVGDMLMSEPVLQALHDKYAPCEITYRTHRHVYDLMLYHPLIDKILCTRTGCWTPTPDGYDVHINLHGVIEASPFGVHGTDAFAKAAGVEVSRRTPVLHLSGEMCHVETEDDRYPVISHPPVPVPDMVDISVHVPSESRNSLWAPEKRIYNRMWDHFFYKHATPTMRIVGQDPIEPGKSNILKMANEIKQSRMFVGPDSGGFHIAAALGIPAIVSLTEEFPASMRGYSKVVVVGDHQAEEVFSTALAMYRRL